MYSPGPGLWSLVLGPYGPDLGPDLDLTWDLDLDLSLTISKIILEWSPLLLQQNKFQVDRERKDMGKSTMFKGNIIKLTYCTIIKMPASRVEKFSVGWTLCRSPMKTRAWWNSPTLIL